MIPSPSWLTVKPLLALAGLLVLALGIQGALLYKAHADVQTARASVTTEQAKTAQAITQRDANIALLTTARNASDGWQVVAGERDLLLKSCQAENERLWVDNQNAIDAANQKAQTAERTLKQFIERYATDLRNPDCAAARTALDKKCALTNY